MQSIPDTTNRTPAAQPALPPPASPAAAPKRNLGPDLEPEVGAAGQQQDGENVDPFAVCAVQAPTFPIVRRDTGSTRTAAFQPAPSPSARSASDLKRKLGPGLEPEVTAAGYQQDGENIDPFGICAAQAPTLAPTLPIVARDTGCTLHGLAFPEIPLGPTPSFPTFASPTPTPVEQICPLSLPPGQQHVRRGRGNPPASTARLSLNASSVVKLDPPHPGHGHRAPQVGVQSHPGQVVASITGRDGAQPVEMLNSADHPEPQHLDAIPQFRLSSQLQGAMPEKEVTQNLPPNQRVNYTPAPVGLLLGESASTPIPASTAVGMTSSGSPSMHSQSILETTNREQLIMGPNPVTLTGSSAVMPSVESVSQGFIHPPNPWMQDSEELEIQSSPPVQYIDLIVSPDNPDNPPPKRRRMGSERSIGSPETSFESPKTKVHTQPGSQSSSTPLCPSSSEYTEDQTSSIALPSPANTGPAQSEAVTPSPAPPASVLVGPAPSTTAVSDNSLAELPHEASPPVPAISRGLQKMANNEELTKEEFLSILWRLSRLRPENV